MDRKAQILQTLAQMLEHPRGERVTTAALAAQVHVSEAALYRHFASKAQMFDGLIDYIETTIFRLINHIGSTDPESGAAQMRKAVVMLLSFAERNRGLTRILTGDALVIEDNRLQERVNQFIDRVEASFRQMLRNALIAGELAPNDDLAARANLILNFVLGRWHRFAKSGWRHTPTEHLDQQFAILMR